MSQTPSTQVDLAKLFNTVTQTLKENQDSLNATDDYNHNHGDNMVDNFQVITKAMRETKGSAPADQLAYASQMLSQFSQSGSAQLYSQGLAQAAQSFQGKPAVTPNDAMLLVQSLMGGQPGASQSGGGSAADLLGGLLGGAPAAARQLAARKARPQAVTCWAGCWAPSWAVRVRRQRAPNHRVPKRRATGRRPRERQARSLVEST